MKKIFTLIAVLAAFTASARDLTFFLKDTPIETGSTIEFSDFEITDYGTYREVKMAPELYVKSDIFTNKVKVVAECTSGQVIQMCAGGACAAGATVTKENVTVRANEKLPLVFDYITELDPGQAIPKVTVKFTAQDGTYTQTNKSFTIVMAEKTGVGAVVADNAPVEYFTLQGVRVDNPGQGLYIRRQGNKVSKIVKY